MIKSNKEVVFEKFINMQNCTYEEFITAERFSMNYRFRNIFLDTIFNIIKKCLDYMLENNISDFSICKNIYSFYGISESYFIVYLNLLLKKIDLHEENKKYKIYEIIAHEKMSEIIFNMAKDMEWKNLNIISFAYDISLATVNDYIRYYAYSILKLDIKGFSDYKRFYPSFISFIKNKKFKVEYALEFYDKFATKEEKIAFSNHAKSVINNSLLHLNNKLELANYLNNIGMNEYMLLKLILLFNNKLIDYIYKSFKKYYEYCSNNNWNKNIIEKKACEYNLSYQEFIKFAKLYAKNILKNQYISEEVAIKKYVCSSDTPRFAIILYQILKETDEEVIYELFEQNNIYREHISRFCYSKARDFTESERIEYEKDLLNKFLNYKELKRKFKRNTNIFPIETYIDFLNSDLNISEYCKIHNLPKILFKLALLNVNDLEIAQKVKDKLNRIESEKKLQSFNATLDFQAKVISFVSYINNGITINNVNKSVDLLDYFILFRDINPYNIYYPYLTKIQQDTLYDFFKKYFKSNIINRQCLSNSYLEINYLNKDTDSTQNSTYIINADVINYIISFLESYHVPLLDTVFDIAVKRYLNGTLDIYKTDEPTLK